MMVAHELGKSEEELSHWKLNDLIRWIAYFKLKDKFESEAIKSARRR
jgi:hypothetical protein